MAQKKKGLTAFKKQKIAQNQYARETIVKLIIFLKAIYGDELFSKIPVNIISNAFISRVHSFKIIASPGCNVSSSLLNETRKMLLSVAKSMNISVIPGKLDVSLVEFYSVGLTSFVVLPSFLADDPGVSDSIKLKSDELKSLLDSNLEEANDLLFNVLVAFGMTKNEISKTQYYLNHKINSSGGLNNTIAINTYKIEPSSIIVDNIPRPAFRVGYAFPNFGIDWVSIDALTLNIQHLHIDTAFDVYIQSHALQRLSERMDCFPAGLLHYNMFISLKFPKVFRDSNQNILIEFRFFEVKAGYFLVDLIDEKVLIKTFLFLTNNGAPEGQKLGSITGLQKFDKKYLALDRLSTFMTSEIGENETLRSLLISADCGCLLDLYERTKIISTNTSKKFDAEFMLKYISQRQKHIPDFKAAPILHNTDS